MDNRLKGLPGFLTSGPFRRFCEFRSFSVYIDCNEIVLTVYKINEKDAKRSEKSTVGRKP